VARFPHSEFAQLYPAMEKIVDLALRHADSFFTPGHPVWTPDIVEDLHRRVAMNPDEGHRDFITILREQLRGAPDATIQLAAETLYVHLIVPCVLGGDSKKRLLENVLGWQQRPITVPGYLWAALSRCLIRDPSFNLQRPPFLRFLVNFARAWSKASPERRSTLLDDPWAFKGFVLAVPSEMAYGQREALFYIVHPDTFEAISSRKHKLAIATVFRSKVETPNPDVDLRLLEIRRALTPRFGEGFHYYREPVKSLWQKTRPVPEPPKPALTVPKTPAPTSVDSSAGNRDESPSTIDQLAAQLLLDVDAVDEMVNLVLDRKQAIFYGPPGTGKTFVARRIADYLTGDRSRVTLVQFHPAYSYEDFVEGYRPAASGFTLVAGPLRRIAEKAAANPA
jgi:5-methylcytosine-specific restriction enzyme B